MSLGELINMYRDGELAIHPAYQRLFRWSDAQKSKLIDSILLGIPIPSIFVSQREDGVWELVDGLQRIGTILQLVGILRDHNNDPVQPLKLSRTKALPSLEGKIWSETPDDPASLSPPQKLLIKRSKVDVQIVLKESNIASKYELFQRLNTTGSPLEPMEIRNCLLIMANPEFAAWLKELAEDPHFRACVPLSDKAIEELGDREMVARFLALRTLPEAELRRISDVAQFLDEKLIQFASDPNYQREDEEQAFRQTFKLIFDTLGEDAFRRYDRSQNRFMGMFLVSAYEVIGLGIGSLQPGWMPADSGLIGQIARDLWANTEFTQNSGMGINASRRLKTAVPLGRRLFRDA